MLMTENGIEFVAPTVTAPKSRLDGLMTNCGGLMATMRFALVLVLTPTGPVTMSRTVLVPATVGGGSGGGSRGGRAVGGFVAHPNMLSRLTERFDARSRYP